MPYSKKEQYTMKRDKRRWVTDMFDVEDEG